MAILKNNTSSSNIEDEENLFVGPSPSYMILNISNQGRQEMLTTDHVTIWDQNKVSDRATVTIIEETVRSLRQDIHPLVLNHLSIRLQRLKHRETTAERIKYQFDLHFPLVVHWNGELFTVITATKSGSRSPVLVTNIGLHGFLQCQSNRLGQEKRRLKPFFLF